ncbi:AAA family ATPase [Sabulicella glaciei]|uniref:AAA family ATPase n=1 Tax=Sabulicella glaciei TaxID=2984948 RepID=A0ABT3NZW2_9PROT|nr:AAA family ATPase [Roseococcus sp. MDT2-1-1]MCW8087701.1 AAA family ATPase [Roseococcus sp. MDT2-1-1]
MPHSRPYAFLSRPVCDPGPVPGVTVAASRLALECLVRADAPRPWCPDCASEDEGPNLGDLVLVRLPSAALRVVPRDVVPTIHGPVAYAASDQIARTRLAGHAELRPIPDGGDVRRLWAVGQRLDLAPEGGADDTDEAARRLADIVALVLRATPASPDGPARRALDAAVDLAALLVRVPGLTDAPGTRRLLPLARAAGLHPRPGLGAWGLPLGLAPEVTQALRGAEAARLLLRLTAEQVAGARLPGALPVPVPRPLLLMPPPASGDPMEGEVLEALRPLAEPLPLIPAPDAREVEARLVEEFPWLVTPARAVARELALAALGDGACRLPPLLLVGPPGAGKTRWARALAEACGLPWRRLAAPDGGAAVALTGNGRGWRSPRPCFPVEAVRDTQVLNPLLVMDDIDRASADDRHGTVAAVLLSLLEPESARHHLDLLAMAPADLSHVGWVFTANDTAGLPGALLDRLLVLQVDGPPPEALPGLLRGMLRDLAQELGLAGPEGLPPLPAGVTEVLQCAMARESGARTVRVALRQVMGAIRRGEDPASVAYVMLEHARTRDDRAYAGGRMGYAR